MMQIKANIQIYKLHVVMTVQGQNYKEKKV